MKLDVSVVTPLIRSVDHERKRKEGKLEAVFKS
jgi:hypothetical protein